MISPEIRCENCIFYQGVKDTHNENGFCMRFPPSVYPKPTQVVAHGPIRIDSIIIRPQVRAGEFCGEFAPAQAAGQSQAPNPQIKPTSPEN